jgi:hypothetical protein
MGRGRPSVAAFAGRPLGVICCEYITLDHIVWKATGARVFRSSCRPLRKPGLLEAVYGGDAQAAQVEIWSMTSEFRDGELVPKSE